MLIDNIFKSLRKVREKSSKRIKKLRHVKNIDRHLIYMRQIAISSFNEEIKKGFRYQDPKRLIKYGRRMYSQNEEDGIIREIFNRVGVANKIFVEIGCGDGLENNTLALLLDGWRGLWIEGSSRFVNGINDHFQSVLNNDRLKVVCSYVTAENINEIVSANIKESEIDFLSIDIDGNDVHVFNAISVINPRVVAIEYNPKFFPPTMFCLDYDPNHAWQGDDYMGASLKYLERDFGKKGYSLVGCDLSGTNAFFVRNDLLGDKFLSPYSAEEHYEQGRAFTVGMSSGSPVTYNSIGKILAACEKMED